MSLISVLKFHLGSSFSVGSDGDFHDWADGVELANKVLKRTKNKIINPIEFFPENDLKIV